MSARTLTKIDQKDQISSIRVLAPRHVGHDTALPTPALQQAWRMIQNCDRAEAANVFRWRDRKLSGFNPSTCIVSRDGLSSEVDAGTQIPRSTQPIKPAHAPWKLEA